MPLFLPILAAIVAILLATYLLPRTVVVTRTAYVAAKPADILARAASTDGFQTFNPYCTTDPDLKITPFGPASGVDAGFRFEGKEGKGTQTITAVTDTSVTYLIDLGAMGKPVQVIAAKPSKEGSEVTWSVTSDMGMNPIFRVFGLFMDRMLGKTYELGLKNLKAVS